MAKPGDKVTITTEKQTETGILIPSPQKDVMILKLDTGYNIGFPKSDVQEVVVLEHAKEEDDNSGNEVSKNPDLPTISILHTGGTIASKVDYKTGGVYAKFTIQDFLEMFPQIKDIANITSAHISNMMSEDMRFSHYKTIANEILAQIKKGVKGIIIGHGTDTLAVTASALAFMFENLPIPVILVGAQRSSDRGSSDAQMNLICAAHFIAKSDFKGVAVCMHESSNDETCLIMSATKTRKLHTSRRDAFKVVNDTPIAKINYSTGTVTHLKKYAPPEGECILKDTFEDKVAIVKTHVNMSPVLIRALTQENYKGLVLEATGLGQAPTNIKENEPNYHALIEFMKNGGVIVLTSQCIFGTVHPYIYANCRRLHDIGMIFGKDMLTETAHIKLSWLLANYDTNTAKKMVVENLRGEINEQLKYEDSFIKEN